MIPSLAPYKAVGFLAGSILILTMTSGATWYYTKEHVTNKYELVISKAENSALKRLNELLEQKNETENKLQTVKGEIQSEYQKTIDENAKTIARLRASNVRLRDPGEKDSRDTCTPDSTSPGSTTGSTPGKGALSEQASGFLLDYALEADKTLEQLRACRAWGEQIKKELDDFNKNKKPS